MSAPPLQTPPPWTLRGDGYMLFYLLPPEQTRDDTFAPLELAGRQVGRITIVILVDYRESNAGAYREIFIAPGAFRFFDDRVYRSVTKIYVETQASVVGGRQNWGIPKELAAFEIRAEGPGVETYVASSGGSPFAEMTLRSHAPGLPAAPWMLPLTFRRFAQVLDGRSCAFDFSMSGTARRVSVVSARFDPTRFPDLNRGRFLAGARMSHLAMNMPVPRPLPGPQ